MNRRGTRYLFASALLTLAFSTPECLFAQNQNPPRWSVITVTTIKPDARAEFEAWQKQITAAFRKAEVPSRTVLQTVLGDLFEYITVAPIQKLGDMDGASPVQRALGQEAAAALTRRGTAYVTSAHRLISREIPELSIVSPTAEPPALAFVTTLRLMPGHADEFTSWVRDEYVAAAKKAEIQNLWISSALFGGDPNERVIVRPMKSMAEFDAGPFTTKALGPEGARKMMSKTAAFVESTQYRVVRYRADMSYMSRPNAAKPAPAQ